jgi:DNA-directed RNA polymerase subunit RPC12/RpoP
MKRKIKTRRVARRRMSIHSMVWLIGLVVIALTDSWWPGILILVIISVLLDSAMKRGDKDETGEELPEPMVEKKPDETPSPPPRVETAAPPVGTHRADWLPLNCPKCGAPTRAAEVRWTGDSSAACPYCGSNLPLKKS